MLKASWQKYTLQFQRPAGTSRGVYTARTSWFVFLTDPADPRQTGLGECAPLPGLSPELDACFEARLTEACRDIERDGDLPPAALADCPSIRMGMETALLDCRSRGTKVFYENWFTAGTRGIPINGLVWMGSPEFMDEQIRRKLQEGYACIKLKVGALDFAAELALIRKIRRRYGAADVAIRVDANGAFEPADVLNKLNDLAALDVHSIEQPVRPGQRELLARLCATSPLPIALDEELTGTGTPGGMRALLDFVRPQFLVLKPSLHGGFAGCAEWIRLADEAGIGWWVTSALESNIGLNAIAQWTSTLGTDICHGLGTGQLFANNFPSPLYIDNTELQFAPGRAWDIAPLCNND